MINEEIREIRRSGLGGSDIGAILGMSRFRSPYDVYLSKIGEEAEQEENDAIYWGNVLEDVVAREYQNRTGRKVQRINTTIRHPDYPWAIANLDRAVVNPEIKGRVYVDKNTGWLTTDRILECKTANGFATKMWGEPGSDFVPDAYYCQVQWYMFVTGTKTADLAVLIGGQDYRVYTIERNDPFIAEIHKRAAQFWNENVQKRIPPAPVNPADAVRLYPKAEPGKAVVASEEAYKAYKALEEVRDQIKELGLQEDALKGEIMAEMGDAESITFNGAPLATWKSRTTNRLDSKLLKAEHPDIYGLYTKQSESRYFLVK